MLNSNIKTYNCNIQTLSPIHIGSGASYSPLEFVSTKAKDKTGKIVRLLRRINFDKYYSNLSNDRKDEFLENIVNPNFKLSDFDDKIKKDFRRYDSISKSNEDFSNEVSEHIRTMNELFIPGSSLKGAIKTAILYDNINKGDMSKIDNLFRYTGSKKKVVKREYNNFINNIFASKYGGKSAQYDISKFLQIFDSNSLRIGEIHEVVAIKARDPTGFEQHKIRGNPVSSFLEVIPKKKLLESKISINYDEKIYRSLNLSEKSEMIDVDNIKESIYKFSKDFISNEIDFYKNYAQSKLEENLLKFYEKLNEINNENNPVIKIGSGSGFLATTIGLKIKEYNPSLFESIRQSLRGKNYEYEFPKSRKISKIGMPLGWAKLTIIDF